nr:S8 family peptidase [Bacillus kexueae]
MIERKMKLLPYETIRTTDSASEVPDGVQVVQAPSIWREGMKGKGMTIAVLDTGCDRSHPDLQGQIIGGRNFTTDDGGDPRNYSDYHGHGTHVAGTIAARESNSGVTGVAPQAKLLVLKVLGQDPANPKRATGRYEWIVEGIQYAIKRKVDIISMSLGGPSRHKGLHESIQKAVAQNILVVCAAGNDGDGDESTDEYTYPGAYNEVISVGAIGKNRNISRFTNSNNEVDLVAPGEEVISTVPNGKYASFSGTSMATPHVAGALALIKQQTKEQFDRSLSEPELYAQLIKRTVPLGHAKSLEGNGLLYLTTPYLLSRFGQSDVGASWFRRW